MGMKWRMSCVQKVHCYLCLDIAGRDHRLAATKCLAKALMNSTRSSMTTSRTRRSPKIYKRISRTVWKYSKLCRTLSCFQRNWLRACLPLRKVLTSIAWCINMTRRRLTSLTTRCCLLNSTWLTRRPRLCMRWTLTTIQSLYMRTCTAHMPRNWRYWIKSDASSQM